jgi:hypothetical protein
MTGNSEVILESRESRDYIWLIPEENGLLDRSFKESSASLSLYWPGIVKHHPSQDMSSFVGSLFLIDIYAKDHKNDQQQHDHSDKRNSQQNHDPVPSAETRPFHRALP